RIGSEAALSLPWKGNSTAIWMALLRPPPLGPQALRANMALMPTTANLVNFMYISSNDHAGRDRPTSVSFTVGRTGSASRPVAGASSSRPSAATLPPGGAPVNTGSECDRQRREDRCPDGAQVAAEAMPYHTYRPADCNPGRRAIRHGRGTQCVLLGPREPRAGPRPDVRVANAQAATT